MKKLSCSLKITSTFVLPMTLGLLALSFSGVVKAQKAVQPNVILILVDDLGYADVSFNGGGGINTPNIDRIASSGVKFTRGYVTFPACGPSRAGLITGRHQSRFGFESNPADFSDDIRAGLPISEKTIPEVIDSAGYTSVAIGKWHLGYHRSLRPNARGFDDFFGFLGGQHTYFAETFKEADFPARGKPVENRGEFTDLLLRNDEKVETSGYLTDVLSDEAVRYIRDHDHDGSERFFMYLAYNAPHVPAQAKPEDLEALGSRFSGLRKTYAAMVKAVDRGVGQVLDELEAQGVDDDTMVFFLSDNGAPVTKRSKNGGDNTPLRGQKADVYEGGIRVPFAMQWPAQIPAGTVYDNPISSLDILGTIVGVNDIDPPKKLDGVNLIPFLTGEKTGQPHRALHWRSISPKSATSGDPQYPLKATIVADKKRSQSGTEGIHYTADIADSGAEDVVNNQLADDADEAASLERLHETWTRQLGNPPLITLFNAKGSAEAE